MSTLSEAASQARTTVDTAQVAVVVPTCNAARDWPRFNAGLRAQGLPPNQILIIDSESNDGTRELAAAEGYTVVKIPRREFNHGGTRQRALSHVPWATIAVYLTQDAVLATSDAIDRLLEVFTDPQIGAVFGRQLPRPGAGPIETHARLFNYPEASGVRDFESRKTLGIKATFLSNSFAAYRVDALCAVGGFPTNTIIAEDALVAGRLLLAGWKTAYVAEAQVYHSHGFTVSEEFRRYFDTGVYHHREAWLREKFGGAGGEGKRFVMSELRYLTPRHMHLVPLALLRTVSKAVGYHLGRREAKLGRMWAKRLSYHKGYWG
jgi:rhamnosyltransferase